MADLYFLVLLNMLALKVRPLECFVIATVFNWDFMLRVFIGRDGFPLAQFQLIWVGSRGSYIFYLMVSHLHEEPGRVSVRIRRVRGSTCNDGFMFLDQSC